MNTPRAFLLALWLIPTVACGGVYTPAPADAASPEDADDAADAAQQDALAASPVSHCPWECADPLFLADHPALCDCPEYVHPDAGTVADVDQ